MADHRILELWLQSIVSRRSFLTSGLALAGLARVGTRAYGRAAPRWRAPLFTLGVASGDPSPDGVVLWTRLATDPLNGGGMPDARFTVEWEIGTDDQMRQIAARGRTEAVPEWAHSVHVEVGGLDPDRWYWYRFRAAGEPSPIGRTRTLPRAGTGVDRLRFAFASCQHFEEGLFTAYRHLAAEDLDLVFHLGDYIYENAGDPAATGRVRTHIGPEIVTLADYRNRYAQYRSDPDLQAAHAAFPWIVTWDDHEVDNNYANDISERNDPRDAFLLRRAAAYQAYYEHMPLRRASIPTGSAAQIFRSFSYGRLASFFVLDTRQYRTDQPCNDGSKPPCAGVVDPAATLLGARQERWLLDGLSGSRAAWNVLPQQVMMARVDLAAGPDERLSMDQWSAYERERTRLVEFFATRRPANPIVLTGDIHSNWVNDLKVNFTDRASPVVATEFVGTSISSGGDGSADSPRTQAILSENPFVKFHNSQRGYVSSEVTPKMLTAKYQVVEYVTRPGAPRLTRAAFVVESGRPGAVRDTG